jgi:hypothetical protein
MSIDNDNQQIDNVIDQQEPDELIIQFEGEDDNNDDEGNTSHQESSVIKDLRKQLRTQAQELAKVKPNQQQDETIVLGNKPTLEACDYDTDKHEAELDAWYDRKQKLADQERAKNEQSSKLGEKQAKQLQEYEAQAKALNARDFADKQQTFLDYFNNTPQGKVIMSAAKNKALVVYALGSDTRKLEALTNITDDIELAAEVARIESKIKVQTRQSNITPEKTVKSDAGGANASQSATMKQLEKLRANAVKTGNYTEVRAFKKANNIKD